MSSPEEDSHCRLSQQSFWEQKLPPSCSTTEVWDSMVDNVPRKMPQQTSDQIGGQAKGDNILWNKSQENMTIDLATH